MASWISAAVLADSRDMIPPCDSNRWTRVAPGRDPWITPEKQRQKLPPIVPKPLWPSLRVGRQRSNPPGVRTTAMSTPANPRESTRYTWSDYRSWGDEERWEIIDGAPYAMAPAPPTERQGIVLRLSAGIERGLAGKACRPFIAPPICARRIRTWCNPTSPWCATQQRSPPPTSKAPRIW